jgi:hypothetical protein
VEWLFTDVYEDMPWNLQEELADLRTTLRK